MRKPDAPAPKNDFRLRRPPDPEAGKPAWLKTAERVELALIRVLLWIAGICVAVSLVVSLVTWDATPFLGVVVPAAVVYILVARPLNARDLLYLNWWKD